MHFISLNEIQDIYYVKVGVSFDTNKDQSYGMCKRAVHPPKQIVGEAEVQKYMFTYHSKGQLFMFI